MVLVPSGYRRAIDDRDGQAFELLFLSKDLAGKPALEEGTLTSSRFNSEDQLRGVEARAAHDAVSASAMLHNKVLELTGSCFDARSAGRRA